MTAPAARTAGPSLLRRLVLHLTLATLVAILVFLGLSYLQLTSKVDSLRDRSLTGQAEDIARHITLTEAGRLTLGLPEELAQAYGRADGRFMFQVRSAEGELLFASAGGAAVLDEIDGDPASDSEVFLIEPPGQQRVYAAQLRVAGPAGPLLVRVGQGRQHDDVLLDELLEEFFPELGWMLIPLLGVLLLINIVTLKQGLAPIRMASAQAASIGPTTTELRLPEAGMPQEIQPLVHAVNAAFERLDRGFQQQRAFTADAAHELRTPLAVLSAHLDVLENRAAVGALREDVATMSRIVEQLLRVAHLDTLVAAPEERADLRVIVNDVAGYLAPLAVRENKTLAVSGCEGVVVAADGEVLGHALRNLVENAIAHTPPGTTVEIAVREDGELQVSDQGPGVPPDQRELVFQRFWRGERSGRRRSGAGLGLSIVARTAEAYGGEVSVDDAPAGGACFSLKLPRVAA